MDQNRTDSELLADFASAANQSSFTQLVERYLPLVLRTARRCLPDAHAADDIAQAVFFCLARKARKLDGRDLAGWLVRATTLASKEAIFETQTRPVTALCLSPDGRHLYASTNAGLTAFDTSSGKPSARLDLGTDILCLDISPDAQYIAAGDMQNNVNILDAASLKMLARDDRSKNPVLLIRFLANDQFLSSSYSDPLRLWQLRSQPTSRPTR